MLVRGEKALFSIVAAFSFPKCGDQPCRGIDADVVFVSADDGAGDEEEDKGVRYLNAKNKRAPSSPVPLVASLSSCVIQLGVPRARSGIFRASGVGDDDVQSMNGYWSARKRELCVGESVRPLGAPPLRQCRPADCDTLTRPLQTRARSHTGRRRRCFGRE